MDRGARYFVFNAEVHCVPQQVKGFRDGLEVGVRVFQNV